MYHYNNVCVYVIYCMNMGRKVSDALLPRGRVAFGCCLCLSYSIVLRGRVFGNWLCWHGNHGLGTGNCCIILWHLPPVYICYPKCSSWHGNRRCNLPFLVPVAMATCTKFSSSVYSSNSAGTVTRHLQGTANQYARFTRKYSNITLLNY